MDRIQPAKHPLEKGDRVVWRDPPPSTFEKLDMRLKEEFGTGEFVIVEDGNIVVAKNIRTSVLTRPLGADWFEKVKKPSPQ